MQRVPDLEVVFCASEPGELRTDNGMLGVMADVALAEIPAPEVVLVPGGIGSRAAMRDPALLNWLAQAHHTSRYTTSVCTGALVLAAAGLLDGLTATTHWAAREILREYGAQPVEQRVVTHADQRIITAAGVSAGIDMALQLVAELYDDTAAKAAQLFIEYDPQPPFDSGSLERAAPEVRARLGEYRRRRQ
ncbi:DJ-1/PfpI family protein [Blastococcus sp. Marseille-P5729]|uniref:DJ-1/PfpI family protein n=1 Tax=Blastococcus sp. Marseille-P5729 TaxID=2086582 RepID=UPI000D0F2663|nr:DJ-1/PfpI family protein [Blastococcus sp. Marseille-P5729]